MAFVGRNAGFTCAAALLLLLNCGGESSMGGDDAAATGGTPATTAGSGGSATMDGCLDAGAPEAGCGGEAGDSPLAPYARLRTACSSSVNVNRRGAPVAICFSIH